MPDRSVVSRILHTSANEEPLLKPGSPWWEQLPEDFWRRREPFDDLESRDTRSIRITATTDRALRTLAGAALVSTALPLGYGPKGFRDLQRQIELYEQLLSSKAKQTFFREPKNTNVVSQPARRTGFRPWDGSAADLSFKSRCQPYDTQIRRRWNSHTKNRTAHMRLWQHRDGPRPTIVAIHGFAAEGYRINEWFFALPWLYGMGCDVALFTLPFHGPRQARFSPFSGHGFFAGGLGWTNEAFAQGVEDFRVFMDYLLHERGVPQVGVTGVSLGGHTAALLAAVEPRLAFSIPNVPVASIPDLALEWEPMGMAIRAMLRVVGHSITDVRRMSAPSCPLTWAPVIEKDRLMVIGGVGDRMAPPKHTRLLWDHWGHCRIHWFPGSHILHLDRGTYLWQVARFLRGIGFLEADHPQSRRTLNRPD